MPEYQISGAIYYAHTPNTVEPSAKLIVYLRRGWNREPNALLISFERTLPIPDRDWDDLDVDSARLAKCSIGRRARLAGAYGLAAQPCVEACQINLQTRAAFLVIEA